MAGHDAGLSPSALRRSLTFSNDLTPLEPRRSDFLATPVSADGRQLGALNLYRDEPPDPNGREVHVAELLTSAIAAALVTIEEQTALQTLFEQLKTALTARAVIDHAKGIIIAREGCDPDAAFEGGST